MIRTPDPQHELLSRSADYRIDERGQFSEPGFGAGVPGRLPTFLQFFQPMTVNKIRTIDKRRVRPTSLPYSRPGRANRAFYGPPFESSVVVLVRAPWQR